MILAETGLVLFLPLSTSPLIPIPVTSECSRDLSIQIIYCFCERAVKNSNNSEMRKVTLIEGCCTMALGAGFILLEGMD